MHQRSFIGSPWKASPDEEAAPDTCSFTESLAYLSISHDDGVEDYKQLIPIHVSKETFLPANSVVVNFLLDE
jgi:hypothetical protein